MRLNNFCLKLVSSNDPTILALKLILCKFLNHAYVNEKRTPFQELTLKKED